MHVVNCCRFMLYTLYFSYVYFIFIFCRQYEIKERAFRNQLLTLSAVLPILQHHILLCRNFVSTSNKYHFLEIVSLMIDRLNTIVKIPQPTK